MGAGSKMLDQLYGPAANEVNSYLEELDPELNAIVQDFAYDTIWAREELSLREKSLVTIAALVAAGKEGQTTIHMKGFLNSSGTPNEIKAALIHLIPYCGFPSVLNAFAALKKAEHESVSE